MPSRSAKPPHAARRGFVRSLHLESLESRHLLATVTSPLDTGAEGELRTVLANAAIGETIDFALPAGAETIQLEMGELRIDQSLIIDGANVSGSGVPITIQPSFFARVFTIDDGNSDQIDVHLENLTLTEARVSYFGGAILNREQLTVTGSTISRNEARYGGGIWNSGTLTITQSTFTENWGRYDGGGIWNSGTVTVSDSTLTGNTSLSGTGGGAGVWNSGAATITYSTISSNVGDGILNQGTLSVSSSTLSQSQSGSGIFNRYAGTTTVADSVIANNSAQSGGGIRNGGANFLGTSGTASVVVINSTLHGNTAWDGGAIWNGNEGFREGDATVTIIESTISGNSAGDGAGVWNSSTGDVTASIEVIDSTVAANSATGHGGGIFNYDQATIHNSTLSGNYADQGGGIFSGTGGTTLIANSTIYANSSGNSGDGIYVRISEVHVDHSIVAGNTCRRSFFCEDVSGSLASDTFNLIGSEVAPLLGPLADNGGPTHTHALLVGSPAINAGDPDAEAGVGATPEFDQRGPGFSRIHSQRIDIGAVESNFSLPSQGLVVSTDTDIVDGDFSEGQLSLREAFSLANSVLGTDTITFAPSLSEATITLSGTELTLFEAVTVDASSLPAGITLDAAGQSRVLHVVAADQRLTLKGLTLTGGGQVQAGGGIRLEEGELELLDSTISHSSAAEFGGGIWSEGSLSLRGSTITASTAAEGGGVHSAEQATVVDSTVSDNQASYGGGLFNTGTLTLTSSTVSGNTASSDGGGLWTDGTATVSGSTLSGNSSGHEGGGLYNAAAVTVTNSTLTANSARWDGGGIRHHHHGSLAVHGSIVAGNTAEVIGNDNIRGSLDSDTFNLIDADAEPLLGPLADNGGFTQTHALLVGSQAINVGDPSAMAGVGSTPAFDQRGTGFPRVMSGRIDIGAVESSPFTMPGQGLVVSNAEDLVDHDFSEGQLSLREAVLLANAVAGPDVVTFDSSLAGIPLALSGRDIPISDAVIIDATAVASGVTIDGGGASRIFNVDAPGHAVTLKALTLTGGDYVDYGGAIRVVAGDVLVDRCTITGNSAGAGGGIGILGTEIASVVVTESTISGNAAIHGGGIWIDSHDENVATLQMTRSLVTGNFASAGGAIFNEGVATVSNSTLSANWARDGGGALYNRGAATITHSTLTGNSASSGGGIVMSFDMQLTVVHNSIVAGNEASAQPNVLGPLTSDTFNLIDVDPRLGPLADNGGPTRTHALLHGSPAIDAGDPTAVAGQGEVPLYDQRGEPFTRIADADLVPGARIDIGAFESPSPPPVCDFDGNAACDLDDIDALFAAIVAGTHDLAYDLTGDALVDLADRDAWLATAGALHLPSGNAYQLGDANLDGRVDGQDFIIWNQHKFTFTGSWSQGDFNADGQTDGQDFVIWNIFKFQSSDRSLSPRAPDRLLS